MDNNAPSFVSVESPPMCRHQVRSVPIWVGTRVLSAYSGKWKALTMVSKTLQYDALKGGGGMDGYDLVL